MSYKSLHETSTVDLLGDRFRFGEKRSSSVFEVERLIAERRHEGITQYLVSWAGWSPYDASWEDADSVSLPCIEYFEKPEPESSRVLHEVAQFRIAMERYLRGIREKAVTINFSSDVFKFLFSGKGNKHRGWQYLMANHFPHKYFPEGWDKCLNQHGDGIQVQYPIMMHSFLSWSPVKYIRGKQKLPVRAPRCYQERITFKCNKVAGSL